MITVFETIDAVEAKTQKKLDYKEGPDRESDHMWWISDMSKFQRHYPNWKITKNLDYLFNEIIEYYSKTLNLDVKITDPDFFKNNTSHRQ